MFNKVNSSLVAAMNFVHTSFSNLSLTWLFITPASDAVFVTKSLSLITAINFGHTVFTLKSDLVKRIAPEADLLTKSTSLTRYLDLTKLITIIGSDISIKSLKT